MNNWRKKGFTIVELLVVVVVIGILASITIISYSGIQRRATVAAVQAQLSADANMLRLYNVDHGSYPTALDANNCPTTPDPDTKYCVKNMNGYTLTYSGTVSTYTLTLAKGDVSYKITESGGPIAGIVCPTGFIVVPGSPTYGTSDFCVMKYEAKADDNGDGIGDTNRDTGSRTWPGGTYPISASRKLVSTAAGYPVASISQDVLVPLASAADTVKDCPTGCHLISEAEWMTIAQNVLSVASNWSSGVVGTGYIFSGHNDTVPAGALEGDSNDLNGYSGTGQSTPSSQLRTLRLTNGETIWDFAGNVWEWSSGQVSTGQPSGMASWNWYEWTSLSGGTFTVNPFPAGTGLTNASSWNSTNGIGTVYGLTSNSSVRGFSRGGGFVYGNALSGLLAINFSASPSSGYSDISFRIAK